MKTHIQNIFYSFPIQLLLLHFKKHQVMLLFWVLLFSIVTGNFGGRLGIPYLFLDPEYLGEVGFLSFFIIGFAFGGFMMSWNITAYILHSFRFPFLATLAGPFAKFCLNNAIIPLAFVATYFYCLISFQANREFLHASSMFFNLLGFLAGMSLMIMLVISYFFNTNKNVFMMFGVPVNEPKKRQRKVTLSHTHNWVAFRYKEKLWPVRSYFATPFKIRLTRSVAHYKEEQIQSVFRQNHINAMVVELLAFSSLIGLGYLIDYQVFRIPASASMLLICSIAVMLISAFSFWLRGWRTTVFIGLLLILNYVVQFNVVQFDNQAYGLDYEGEKAAYSRTNLEQLSSPEQFRKDKEHGTTMLEHWHKKARKALPNHRKPKLVLINASGGGLRSALWTVNVMQQADSALNYTLLDHTVLMTGASAGVIGLSYYRELYWQDQLDNALNRMDTVHVDNIGKDLLNPVSVTWVVNDMFYLWHKFEYGGYRYQKDRGYMFEQQIMENTNFVMERKLYEYAAPEADATIPLLVMGPTVINDGRRLVISSSPVSYLTRPSGNYYLFASTDIDGMEFRRMFEKQGGDSLRFASALRMNATFPYITPDVSLPSDPIIEVMDAGMRDNFGIQTSVRFLHVFREWIAQNTSGVILIQIRDSQKKDPIVLRENPNIFDKVLNPIGSFYLNWSDFQDFYHDNLVDYASAWFQGRMDVVSFEYTPEESLDHVSLSWHLTTHEKQLIGNAMQLERNQKALERLKSLLQ